MIATWLRAVIVGLAQLRAAKLTAFGSGSLADKSPAAPNWPSAQAQMDWIASPEAGLPGMAAPSKVRIRAGQCVAKTSLWVGTWGSLAALELLAAGV
ncbi:MAG: hypothetical protein EOP38_14910 [Rubrivivax sp.]|nr:MAG: hypothetical protein EOP38_14910 [Rubrivivax sp.]